MWRILLELHKIFLVLCFLMLASSLSVLAEDEAAAKLKDAKAELTELKTELAQAKTQTKSTGVIEIPPSPPPFLKTPSAAPVAELKADPNPEAKTPAESSQGTPSLETVQLLPKTDTPQTLKEIPPSAPTSTQASSQESLLKTPVEAPALAEKKAEQDTPTETDTETAAGTEAAKKPRTTKEKLEELHKLKASTEENLKQTKNPELVALYQDFLRITGEEIKSLEIQYKQEKEEASTRVIVLD